MTRAAREATTGPAATSAIRDATVVPARSW